MTVGGEMQENATQAGCEKVDSTSNAKQEAMTAGEGFASHSVEDLLNQKNNVSGPDTPVKDEDGMLSVEETEKMIEAIKMRLALDDPNLGSLTISKLNAKATGLYKSGELEKAIALYQLLFDKAIKNNLTHPELYVCHGNCAAAYLKLEVFEKAMIHAEKSASLAESSLRRNFKGSSTYIKSFHRKGRALMGLGRHREAALTFERGLELDALNPDLKLGLQDANEAVLKDLALGRSQEHRTITYPEPSQRITYHPYSAPLHHIKTEDLLPLKLLTPFQAENDHHIKDTYNYMTVQSDIRMPKKIMNQLEDTYFNGQYKRAIEEAVASIESTDTDCRVLNLGSGAGVQAVHALRAGARHVTAVERWLYLALATKETLVENQLDEESYSVVYKRPTDLRIKSDVPVCCNLLIANIFDKDLLSSGIIPAVQHSLNELLTGSAIVMPASATVYAQAIELRTGVEAGVDLSGANLYRWCFNQVPCGKVDMKRVKVLSEPVATWYFDFGNPPNSSDTKTIDFTFTEDGRMNAVMFWYDIHLFGEVYLRSYSVGHYERQSYLQPGIQYLAGELRVEKNTTMPIVATHNTVRMQFDIESADYLHLMKRDSSFPHNQFEMLADSSRLQAYGRAIDRAVKQTLEEEGEAHVLDIGTGAGPFAIMAAKAGATSVVACDLHESLCDVARKNAAANNVSKKVSVVHRDAALLQRGKEIRHLGVNLVIADVFDCGLVGEQFEYILELARRKVVQPNARIIPQAATIYCMGIEATTKPSQGVRLSTFDKYRWDSTYEAVNAKEFPFKALTEPVKVAELFFDNENRKNMRETLLKLKVARSGVLNAVMFWFDLHLDDTEENTISGSFESDEEHHWGQAVQYLDRAVPLSWTESNAKKVTLLARRDGSKIHFKLRQGIGQQVEKAPWKIEWGGGASVENPHYQRVHYCELLVRDFLMRCHRFPTIEKDVNMVLAHCGSLFLDSESVQEAGQKLSTLQKLVLDSRKNEFSPGAASLMSGSQSSDGYQQCRPKIC